jgi:hypothetical protein
VKKGTTDEYILNSVHNIPILINPIDFDLHFYNPLSNASKTNQDQ